MIPKSHSLVTLLPERQAALQAIAAVEHAQQRGRGWPAILTPPRL